ncbi:MAG: ABC transporter substrate-binding protein [Defluviitaleaceae bacterium]|nr:ABC transporter substrate-binding protein [Defluviitaleaceae bacterium]
MKKKILFLSFLCAALFLVACGGNDQPEGQGAQPTTPVYHPELTDELLEELLAGDEDGIVTIVDFRRNVVNVRQNPTVVAIYDFGILDMLYTIGFEHTGIETLIIPMMDTLPPALSWFYDGWQDSGINVVTGGTLFYVDWDILNLVNPELVILGVRSFGADAAGNRFTDDETLNFQHDTEQRFANTTFMWLTIDARIADLTNDMRANAFSLAQIFPGIGERLFAEIQSIEAEMAAIREVTTNSGMEAVFLMMLDPGTMTVFLDNSRFGFIFDEFGFAPLDMDLQMWTDQHGFQINSEFLLEHNPDVIFLLDRTHPPTGWGSATDNFMNDAIVQRTNAFINGHIYSGLPMASWYTVVGGFSSARQKIEDVHRFIDNFEPKND